MKRFNSDNPMLSKLAQLISWLRYAFKSDPIDKVNIYYLIIDNPLKPNLSPKLFYSKQK